MFIKKIKTYFLNLPIIFLFIIFFRQELIKQRSNSTKNNLSKNNNFLPVTSVAITADTETMRRNSFINKPSLIFEKNENANELLEANNCKRLSITMSSNALTNNDNIKKKINEDVVENNNKLTTKPYISVCSLKPPLSIKNKDVQNNNIINNNVSIAI